jgi:opacity protein-like surface antigen
MRRTLLSVVTLVVAAGVTPQLAQSQMLIPFVGGGAAFGSGDLGDGTDTGWAGFAGLDYTLSAVPGATIGLTGSYAHIPYTDGGATNIPALTVDLGYNLAPPTSKIQPYIRAGIGVLQHRWDPEGNAESESETKFGGAVGAGLNFPMGSISPFVGAHLVTGGSDTQYYMIYAGLAFLPGMPAPAPLRRFFRR